MGGETQAEVLVRVRPGGNGEDTAWKSAARISKDALNAFAIRDSRTVTFPGQRGRSKSCVSWTFVGKVQLAAKCLYILLRRVALKRTVRSNDQSVSYFPIC